MSNLPPYVVIRPILKAKPNPIGPDLLPIGGSVQFVGEVVPGGYIEPVGQIISIDEYPELYAVIGDLPKPKWWRLRRRLERMKLIRQRQFQVPDLRKRVQVGFDPATKD